MGEWTAARWALRSPVLHFLLLGLLVFATLQERLTPRPLLVVDPGLMQQSVRDWEALQRGPVGPEQRERIREQLARSELLIQLARDAGLERSAAVEQRLAQLARFLGLVDDTDSDTAAVAAARAIDLHRTDTVIRRYLETTAEILLASGTSRQVSDADIAERYAQNAGDYQLPRRIQLQQVFIAGDTPAQEARARALRERIITDGLHPAAARRLGDPFHGSAMPGAQLQRQLADGFGRSFAKAVWDLPVGVWSEPIPSAYGLHLVLVTEEEPARARPLAEVRDEIAAQILRERRRATLEQRLAELERRYRVIHPADPLDDRPALAQRQP